MDTRTLDRSLGQTIHADRCIGSLLGCACGDILGAHFEGTTRRISRRHMVASTVLSALRGIRRAPTLMTRK